MAYEIAHAERFPDELAVVPKKVRKSYRQMRDEILRTSPDWVNPPLVKKLSKYKDLWRLRLSNTYRLVYKVNHSRNIVIMMMIDHRNKIYERLGINIDGEPGIRIVSKAEELLELAPTMEEVACAQAAVKENQDSLTVDKALPIPLDSVTLLGWGVPVRYHQYLRGIQTEEELMYCEDVPEEIIEKVLYSIWPMNIEEVIQRPVRLAADPAHIEEAADGKRSLASFLLMLDDEQMEFVSRFQGDTRPQGPWLLKGGPGSGKSTITLYCIRALLHSLEQLDLFNQDNPLNILYTTFTKSLERATNHLLDYFELGTCRKNLEVRGVDSLAYHSLPDDWKHYQPLNSNQYREYVLAAIAKCKQQLPSFSFTQEDVYFLSEEIDWVLVGQGINSYKDYQYFDRTGRGRPLGKHQRRDLWQLYEVLQDLMRRDRVCLYSERLKIAAENVFPQYDYVFIDEAQDLKAVAIRFLMGLCNNPKNIFITADINQSIWGNGFSWTKMAANLNMQGRARILRRNYRTSKEIWNAVMQLAPDSQVIDQETLNIDAVFRTEPPILALYSNNRQQAERLNSFLWEALSSERAAISGAAVLCPTRREMDIIVKMLDRRFRAKAMRSQDVDISHPGVKVMTMHAAKGLEFPVVAVVGLEAGRLPVRTRQGVDEEEHLARQRRLLFVACSRAMRRLAVFAHRDRPSPFMEGLTEDYWQV